MPQPPSSRHDPSGRRKSNSAGGSVTGQSDGRRRAVRREVVRRIDRGAGSAYRVNGNDVRAKDVALAFAAAVFERPDWLAAARRAWDYVAEEMADGARLRHSARHGQVKEIEFLDDYAEMSRAALMLYEVSAEPVFLARARAWLEILDAQYWDREAGGYFYSPDGGEKLIARSKSAHDNATPAGNGTLVGVLARLYHLTAEDAYLQRASALVRAFSGEIGERFAPMPTLICCRVPCRSLLSAHAASASATR